MKYEVIQGQSIRRILVVSNVTSEHCDQRNS